MVYPAKVTELKRLSPHAAWAVRPVRVTLPLVAGHHPGERAAG